MRFSLSHFTALATVLLHVKCAREARRICSYVSEQRMGQDCDEINKMSYIWGLMLALIVYFVLNGVYSIVVCGTPNNNLSYTIALWSILQSVYTTSNMQHTHCHCMRE